LIQYKNRQKRKTNKRNKGGGLKNELEREIIWQLWFLEVADGEQKELVAEEMGDSCLPGTARSQEARDSNMALTPPTAPTTSHGTAKMIPRHDYH
jgi:hypothetical protein